ncbi:MAG: competence protein CoiA family protein [Balneolaceae bacterium]
MKFALISNTKTEAMKGLRGVCPNCGSELIAKCGEIKVNHWAHKGTRNCDIWWENETHWHRAWKDHFPKEWQEVVHVADDGEKHIADVKTENGWVIEFQHSFLKNKERKSRDSFYPKLVWVVDGLRRKKDINQFQKIFEESDTVNRHPTIERVRYIEECKLLDEWSNSSSMVFFDFHDKDSELWFILPEMQKIGCFLMFLTKNEFIELHKTCGFEKFYTEQIQQLRNFLIIQNQKNRSTNIPRAYLTNRELRYRNKRF